MSSRSSAVPLWLFILVAPFLFAEEVAEEVAEVVEGQETSGDRVPQHTVVPRYPEKARRARVEGEVEVCFKVDHFGKVSRVAVRRSSNRVFERPAKDAVRNSSYQPIGPGEKLSGIKTCRTFRFRLTRLPATTPATTNLNFERYPAPA